jgi:hypothetical protein
MPDCCSYKIQGIQHFIRGGLTIDSGPTLWKPYNHILRFQQTCYITGPLSRQRGFLGNETIFTVRKGATSSYWMLLYAGVWSRTVWPTALLRIINFPRLWRQWHTYAKLQGVTSNKIYVYTFKTPASSFTAFVFFTLSCSLVAKINCKITQLCVCCWAAYCTTAVQRDASVAERYKV